MNEKPDVAAEPARRLRGGSRSSFVREPSRSPRELITDIAIVVVGVVLALAAEQAADSLQWQHRVQTLQSGLRQELLGNLLNAWESKSTEGCALKYINDLEQAILRGDHAKVEQLRLSGWPFGLRRWQDNVWSAALSTAVADHLPQKDLNTYAIIYTGVQVQRQHQNRMQDAFEEAMVARFSLGYEARAAELAAVGRLRSVRTQTAFISDRMLAEAQSKLGLVPNPQSMEEVRRTNGGRCQRFM